jgi:hypothetical protein
MTAYEIPLSAMDQRFSIALAGVTYRLTVHWCEPAAAWTLDIADETDVALVTGVPLVTGLNLLEQYDYLNIGGALYVQTDGDTWAVPTAANLGTAGRLYFVPNETTSSGASTSSTTVQVYLENEIQAVTLIPSCGEFVYGTSLVERNTGARQWAPENSHISTATTDYLASLDQLQGVAPNLKSISLFAAWFGSDLRAANCTIKPKVETADKTTRPVNWSAAGLTRSTADVMTSYAGGAAYGGTPSDNSIMQAITEARSRGISVVFTPFLLMDVAADNTLPDPWRAGTPAGQGAYPWRGMVSVSPALGVAGTVDQTSTAASQITTFVGTAAPADFSVFNRQVIYSGPSEWSYRRFILHYASVCKAAGGVDGFVLGSEMRGLTWVRSDATSTPTFPFVSALASIAADVKTILGSSTKVTYAADWSEFTPYQTSRFGGTGGEIFFHLDSLWNNSHIDAIGIDAYYPLSDWRDGRTHLDYLAGYRSIYDLAYLKANIEGGEGYSWYYASDAAREAQTRTPLTLSWAGDWVWRFKDIRSWWANDHHNRPGAVYSSTPTAWIPESKPIWFTELGCPAIDKGSNQPNVFYDPKSSSSAWPYYSDETSDNDIQRAYLQAMLEYWGSPVNNAVSSVYTGTMIDMSHVHIYTWDARPYPAFPNLSDVWGDADRWVTGHWLTGRLTARA